MTSTDNPIFENQQAVRAPWRKFLDDLIPIRPDIYRYCLSLTGNAWDAEDQVQEALLKVFGALGKIDADLRDPKAYILRIAKHLWIDSLRRQTRYQEILSAEDASENFAEDIGELSLEVSDAARLLFRQLHPQERAALVLKDVLDHSLTEIAQLLNTTEGAVKSALHRGRSRLSGEGLRPAQFGPTQELVQRFMHALEQTDMDTLRTLCAADLHVELVGGADMHSFDDSNNFFAHAHFVMPELGFGEHPRWELSEYGGEPIVLGFRTLGGIEGLNEIHRLEVVGGLISRVRCYCFCPDTLREVAGELGLVALDRDYRSPG